MLKPLFLITIDTEGDDLWRRSNERTTKNSGFLWRFQEICEKFGMRPTYLTDFEMAGCSEFRRLGRDVIRRNTAEIGMHLHAWDTPPISGLTEDDNRYHPFLIEYPDKVMAEKIHHMTAVLEDTFCLKPRSHRAGRWAFDRRYARLLVENGYYVDCSVTPGTSWVTASQAPAGAKGSDYSTFRDDPYWLDLDDISHEGNSGLLEVPVTIFTNWNWAWVRPGIARRALNRVLPERAWLRPNGWNLMSMLRTLRRVHDQHRPHAEFMLHSSELMPGGSPTFESERQIERLYRHLRSLFSHASSHFQAVTLSEFYHRWKGRGA